ncbi:MAG TPA: hypothetical protein VH765_04145 [Xanthobacteraceae bacterium]
MRRTSARLFAALLIPFIAVAPAATAAPRAETPASAEAILGWINQYRHKREPHRVPQVIRQAGQAGALKDPEQAGVYVGFLAGVLNSDPARADQMIAKILPLPPEQQWAVVRAIAYSGLPKWKALLSAYKMHMPGRQPMIDKYLAGKLPTLEQIAYKKDEPSAFAKLFRKKDEPKEARLEPTPDLIDTLWGFYFAAGDFAPIGRIVAMLPWSKEIDDVERLTLGGMAKFTLASNAARDHELLKMLKWTAKNQDKDTTKILAEVIDAAETMEFAKIRKEALAAIEELKRKGPGSRRKLAGWGQVGQGAIALGCIGAAVAGAVALGLPCVIGGAASSAVLNWATQE